MKKLLTFFVAAIIALSFSAVSFAQDKPADTTKDQPAAAEKMTKKKPAKKMKKAKKAKKEEAAPAATEAAPAK